MKASVSSPPVFRSSVPADHPREQPAPWAFYFFAAALALGLTYFFVVLALS